MTWLIVFLTMPFIVRASYLYVKKESLGILTRMIIHVKIMFVSNSIYLSTVRPLKGIIMAFIFARLQMD
jgi:hypothetical protein